MRKMKTGARMRLAIGPALLASTMLGGLPAHAQDSGTLETITVTAEKRSEDLQKTPLAVIALGEEKLDELHVSSFNDYVKYLPSVEYTVGGAGGGNGGPGFANISMRGVNSGNDGNHSGSLPTVGVYLDEQPITTIGGTLDIHIYDIARVEALAGPQGTLYGASSEAGTLRIITNKPDPSGFAASYDLETDSVDHGGIGYTVNGMVNIPIADNAAIRIVAWDEHDAGYIDNVYGTRTYPSSGITINNASTAKKDYNQVNKVGARGALEYDLNENWTITPTFMIQTERSDGVSAYDPSVGDLEVTHFYPEYANDKWYQAALTVQGKVGNLDLTYSGGYMDRKIHAASDYTDYSFWYDTLYGYGSYFTDANGTDVNPSQYILEKDHFTKQSHEVRLASSKDNRLRFLVGAFYERQTHDILQDYTIPQDPGALPLDPALSVPGWENTIWLTDEKRIDRDEAAFGEVSFDVLKNLTLTGGIRFFNANNSLYGFYGFSSNYSSHTGVAACFTPLTGAVNGLPCVNLDKRVKENGETHKINLTWQIDDERMLYATYSTGFRPGGINRAGALPPYSPDTLTNYEIGWKTSWFNNTVRFDGDVYQENWDNFQFSFLGINSLTQISNAGQAKIDGVESNVDWVVNEHLTLTAAGAYNDARLTQKYCGDLDPTTGALDTTCPNAAYPYPPDAPKGTQLPITPKIKVNATARYEFMWNDFGVHFQGSVVDQTKSYPDLRVMAVNPVNGVDTPIRGLIGTQKGFATFDFETGITRDNWNLEFSIQNVFDERAQLYRYAECTTQTCGYQPYVVPDQPRTIGLKFEQKF